MAQDPENAGRKKPASGVLISFGEPIIVFVTVCSEDRRPWIANETARRLLLETWREAEAWLVGYYILMPDHIHFFCAPRDLAIPLDRWVSYWKRIFTTKAQNPEWKWQSHKWDTRLRRGENYTEKWEYVRQNPVRKNLVSRPEDWPFIGMVNSLRW